MKKQLLAVAVAAMCCGTLIGCTSDDATTNNPTSKATTVYSAKKPMGQDSVQTYYTTDDNGDPATIGIAFSSKAMNGIPANPPDNTIMIDFPSGTPAPWTFAMINWNPQGHPPQVYLKPHFDMHFYMTPMQQVMTINANGIPSVDSAIIDKKYVPSTSITDSMIIPFMGVHWLDSTSAELAPGGTFTSTFIYGSLHQNVLFMEPMITREFLDSKPDKTFDVKQPSVWQQTGYYPAQYRVFYDAGTDMYFISLVNLAKH